MKSLTCLLFFVSLFSFQSFFSSEVSDLQARIAKLEQNIAELQPQKKSDKFSMQNKDMYAVFGGKYTQEMFGASNLNFLNGDVINDSAFFLRSTMDYFMDLGYGEYGKPRILAHNTFRFRYKWGTTTEVKVQDASLDILDTNFSIKGTQVNKHLLWSREAWLKVVLGNLDSNHNHYLQIGLMPYQAGRGISFGPAYRVGGFLGFTPGFSIDQFAPAALVHINPVPQKVSLECYFALLENLHTSFSNNNKSIRKKEIGACPQRGTDRYSYAVLTKALWEAISHDKHSLLVEPYIVHLQSPDQKLEFANDLDSLLTTYGFSLEGKAGRFDWGFEAAVNQGQAIIKPWDRNQITIKKNDDGTLFEQYTKILTGDPLLSSSSLASVTSDNQSAVKGASLDPTRNGSLIAQGATLYNAFDRFRPKQKVDLCGYFFVADCAYQVIEKTLNVALGAGFSSGDLSRQQDANKTDSKFLLNQKFSGFVPLQSVYSGKRLRHLIIFNEGVPRFNTKNPNLNTSHVNITPPTSEERAEFSNIGFAGARIEWKPQMLKEYKVAIAPNIICYWATEAPDTVSGKQASNFMGTEVTAEASAFIYDRLKVYGYAGILLPGNYYKDMCGTTFGGQKTGSDIAAIVNIGMNYVF